MRSTLEGRTTYNNSQRGLMSDTRNSRKNMHQEKLENQRFPPEITDEIERNCVENFIDATSALSLETVECGICAEAVRKDDYEEIHSSQIPNRGLLSEEQQPDGTIILDDYKCDDLLLSEGGVQSDQTVVCCKTCLKHLRNDKLPPLSIANGFQIGKTPDELTGLTLPEKLLISLYRPKIYLVKTP